LPQFLKFLPGAASLQRLSALVRNYAGDELEWDIQLVLAHDEVPAATLGEEHRLGWSTWLGAAERTEDADDLVIAGRFARCDP
jgi:type VI secretion system protein ImpH